MKRTAIQPGQKSLKRGSTFSSKRRAVSEASAAQRRKVKESRCVVCSWSEFGLDPAHLAGQGRGCTDERCVVPLCRICHRRFDDGDLDLLSIIAARWPAEREEVQHMLEHLKPVEAIERLAGSRVEWRER